MAHLFQRFFVRLLVLAVTLVSTFLWMPISAAAEASEDDDAPPAAAQGSDDGKLRPSFRYAAMTAAEAYAELDKRGVPYVKVTDRIPGVLAPIRFTDKLHGVHIHSSLPEEKRSASVFEILDARLALALDDFAALLERHEIVELVHYTMYRPNGPKPGQEPADEANVAKSDTKRSSSKRSSSKRSTAKRSSSKRSSAKRSSSKRSSSKRSSSKRSSAKRSKRSGKKSDKQQAKNAKKSSKKSAKKSKATPKLGKGTKSGKRNTAKRDASERKSSTKQKTGGKKSAKGDASSKSSKRSKPKKRSSKRSSKPKRSSKKSSRKEDKPATKRSGKRSDGKRSSSKRSSSSTKRSGRKSKKGKAADVVEPAEAEPVKPVAYSPPGTRHPAGMAIDVGGFRKRDGRWLGVAQHFKGAIGRTTCGTGASPANTTESRELWSIACESVDVGAFTYVLTPNYNEAHRDHFHMEIRPEVTWHWVK